MSMTILPALALAVLMGAPAAAAAGPDRGEELREAARAGDLARARSLLEAGVPVDAPARLGHTALIFAAEKGHAEVVNLLLERGADVNARESFFGTTPLGAALEGGHLALARLFLERGAAGAAEALAFAIEKGEMDLARAALATGRITPLELKAARRLGEKSDKPEMRQLLAVAVAKPRPRSPVTVTADKLKSYAGPYRTREGGSVKVEAREGRLVMSGIRSGEIVLEPTGDGDFETAAGDLAVSFRGRAGTVEWVQVNDDGTLVGLRPETPEPEPLAAATAPAAEAAPRGAPRPWPQFRGTAASGDADGQGVPLRWDAGKGESIRFKTPIPGLALSSPIIWGDRIFVTTAIGQKGDSSFRTGLYGDPSSVDDLSEHSFRLYSLDAGTGAILWEREVHRAKPTVKRHLKSSLANATPATDGKRVVVLFGVVGVLAAYDFAGEKIWSTEIGILDGRDPQAGTAEWGHASSPILHGDLVIVQADRNKDSFIAAYRIDTGKEAWRVARDETSTWSTPAIVAAPTGDELVTNGRLIRAYDPKTGKLLWTLGPNSEVVVATPVVGDGKVYLTAGYPPVRPIYAVRPGHRGDLTQADAGGKALAWSHPRGGTYVPTPILYRGHLYLLNNNGVLSCFSAETGERLYHTRVGEPGVAFSASPVAADGRLYLASETGEVYVLRAGPRSELLATNRMDEVVMATPAASNGSLIVRTLGHVVAIGAPPAAH